MKYRAILLAGVAAALCCGLEAKISYSSPKSETQSNQVSSAFSLPLGQAAFDTSWEEKQLFQEGKALQRQGQLERAVTLYNKVYELDSARIEVLPYWGLAEHRLGHYHKALELYNLYLAKEPQEELVLFNKAVCLGYLGQWTEAEQIVGCLQSSSLANNSQFLAFDGFIDYRLHNWATAEKKLERAWRLDKSNIASALTLALLCQRDNNLEKAAQILQEALLAQPQDPLLINNLGVINWQNREDEKAAANFDNVKEQLGLARLNLAVYQVFSQNNVDVLNLAELTDLFPQNPLAEFLYAVALYRHQRFNEAKAGFSKAEEIIFLTSSESDIKSGRGSLTQKELDELNLVNKNYLALTLASLGENSAALAYYQELYKTQPDNISVCHNLSVLYNKVGHYKNALELAEKARTLVHKVVLASPQSREQYEPVYYNLAYAYSLAKEKKKAAQAYSEWRGLFASYH